jgi:type IV secretion system protein VirB10
MSEENKEEVQEVAEAPATHKKKAQAFLFILLIILTLAMIFNVITGGSKRKKEDAPEGGVIQAQQVNVQTLDERIAMAKRKVQRAEPEPEKQTVEEITAEAKESRQREMQHAQWATASQKRTPQEIYKEAEELRALESRRSGLSVSLDDESKKAVAIQQPVATQTRRNSTNERAWIKDEISRVRDMQQRLLSGDLNAGTVAAVQASPQNLTAQTTSDMVVGAVVQEQNQPKPGQVLLATGTVLSAALDQMTISDFMGSYRAILTRDVYDPSGRYVLLPKGGKIIGKTLMYKGVNQVINNRMVMTVNWLVLPNGKRIDFSKTAVLDAAGVGAIEGDVNYHLIPQILGVAAYATLSTETSYDGTGSDSDSSYEGELGQSMREQFAPMAAKYLNLVPTVTLQPGTPMRIFIDDDLYLTPWDRTYAGVLPTI